MKRTIYGAIFTIVCLSLLLLASHGVLGATLNVNGSSGSCSDSYNYTQAQSLATPLCHIENTMNLAAAGDRVKAYGYYRDENSVDLINTYSSKVILDISEAVLDGSFANQTLAQARNHTISGQTVTVYKRNYVTGSSVVGCYVNDSQNMTYLYPYDTYPHLIEDEGKPEGTYWNNSEDVIYFRFRVNRQNPNLMDVRCFKQEALQVQSSTNIDIIGGLVQFGTIPVDLNTNINVSLINVTVLGGMNSRAFITLRNSNHTRLIGNICWRDEALNGTWGLTKDFAEYMFSHEQGCVWSELNQNTLIKNNIANKTFNGFMVITNSTNVNIQFNDTVIDNYCQGIQDDCIELEHNGNYINASNNTGDSVFVAVSIAPLRCTSGNNTCVVENNKITTNKSASYNRTNPAADFTPYQVKIDCQSNVCTQNVTIKGNTFLNGSSGFVNVDLAHTHCGLYVTNNIFDADSRALVFTGNQSCGNYFENNAYVRRSTGRLGTGYNNGTGDFASLAAALSSSNAAPGWDIQSIEFGFDVGIDLPINYSTYQPDNDSLLCANATRGTIGAISCLSSVSFNGEIFILGLFK